MKQKRTVSIMVNIEAENKDYFEMPLIKRLVATLEEAVNKWNHFWSVKAPKDIKVKIKVEVKDVGAKDE